ncbi:hypothetical protein LCGC14_0236200 [marine sediment metagenome]|uniref:RNA ligase domain-containing protein n=1 Tax=marine sediment metagenome TaxID=412755 RepID=A0A0F9UDQ5_9ZZZZ
MSYMNIDNLYKNQDILLFRECYALEKIHGTSAHISWKEVRGIISPSPLSFFAGGCKHETFISLFDQDDLEKRFEALGLPEVVVFGEAYGGKIQGMQETYGDQIKFIVFEVKIGDMWLSVPQAADVALQLNLEFVHYARVSTDIEVLNSLRGAFSVQAGRNLGKMDKRREGIVLRPLIEVRKNNGKRIIAKHKSDEFKETVTPRKVTDSAKLKVLTEANEIAEEWVTEMRLSHVLGSMVGEKGVEHTGEVIRAMVDDVLKESKDEAVIDKPARKAIGSLAANMFRRRLESKLDGV